MFLFLKKFIAILIIVFLIFPAEFNHIEAASDTLAKTVEFFIGQDSAIETNAQISFPFSIDIPESFVEIKSAVIEISGVSYNDEGRQTVNVDLEKDPDPQGTGADYILAGTSKARPFALNYDASPVVLSEDFPGAKNYTLFLRGASETGNGTFSLFSAKLILTYSHSAAGANFLKTTKFFVGQETGNTPDGIAASKDFIIAVSEQNPIIESVFAEVSGIAKGSNIGAINISAVDQGQPAVYSAYNLDLSPVLSNARFLARHNASANILSASFPGSKNYTLYLKGDGFSANLWNAKLIITYKYTASTGNLPAAGYVISSTFDTGAAKGAAYNSLMWKGSLNGGFMGQAGLQLAASDSITGPWNFEGPDCTSGVYYIADADTPIPLEIACAASHNNKRYFKYKVMLCSSADCVTSGNINPRVDEVTVNWSP